MLLRCTIVALGVSLLGNIPLIQSLDKPCSMSKSLRRSFVLCTGLCSGLPCDNWKWEGTAGHFGWGPWFKRGWIHEELQRRGSFKRHFDLDCYEVPFWPSEGKCHLRSCVVAQLVGEFEQLWPSTSPLNSTHESRISYQHECDLFVLQIYPFSPVKELSGPSQIFSVIIIPGKNVIHGCFKMALRRKVESEAYWSKLVS